VGVGVDGEGAAADEGADVGNLGEACTWTRGCLQPLDLYSTKVRSKHWTAGVRGEAGVRAHLVWYRMDLVLLEIGRDRWDAVDGRRGGRADMWVICGDLGWDCKGDNLGLRIWRGHRMGRFRIFRVRGGCEMVVGAVYRVPVVIVDVGSVDSVDSVAETGCACACDRRRVSPAAAQQRSSQERVQGKSSKTQIKKSLIIKKMLLKGKMEITYKAITRSIALTRVLPRHNVTLDHHVQKMMNSSLLALIIWYWQCIMPTTTDTPIAVFRIATIKAFSTTSRTHLSMSLRCGRRLATSK